MTSHEPEQDQVAHETDDEQDQDAGPASQPTGAAASVPAEDEDPDAGPASEPSAG